MSLAPDLAQRVGDFAQYLTAIGVVAIVGLLWRNERSQSEMKERMKGIETVLSHPEIGVVPTMSLVRTRYHESAAIIQRHDGEIKETRRDIERIEHDVEQLQLRQLVRPTQPEARS
jgi:hypothetical protein